MADVAARLRKLSTNELLSAHRTRLGELADALEAPFDQREPWERLNLFEVFPVAALRAPPLRRGRAIEVAQRVLVFCPVLWTWFCLSRAVAEYESLLADRPSAGRETFLTLWQEGFDGRLWSGFHLEVVALTDALLIAVLLLITAISYLRAQRAQREAVVELRSTEAALLDTLTEASLVLAASPAKSEDAARRRLVRAATAVADASDRLRSAVEAADDVVERLGDNAQGLTVATTSMANVIEQSANTSREVLGGVRVVKDAISALEWRLQRLEGELGNAADAAADAARLIHDGTTAIASSAEQIGGDTTQLADRVAALAGEITSWIGGMKSDRKDLAASLASFSSAVQALAGSSPRLASSSEALAEAARLLVDDEVAATLRETVATVEVGLRELRLELDALAPSLTDARGAE